jgi:glycosyltransferase involved in cell wall biosynthesis
LPVIATRCGGPEEIIADRRTGLLVPINDPNALAQGLRKVIQNEDLARELGMGGQKSARERFSVDTMLSHYEKIYRELCV